MSIKAYAINRIHRRDSKGDLDVVPAGNVFTTSPDEFKKLSNLGAVRTPTNDEVILAEAAEAELSGGTVTKAPKKAAAEKAAAEKAAAEKAAAEKAAVEKAAAEKAAVEKAAAKNDPSAKPSGKKSDDLVI